MELLTYINLVKSQLNQSPVILSVEIVDERILGERGYFRARLTLTNGDFLEIAESFTKQSDLCITLGYRYQWMDGNKQNLIKRWDNVEHFPDLPNFPHHVHIGHESNVQPSQSLNILQLIALIETFLIK